MATESFVFNGINGATGEYLFQPVTLEDISKVAQGETLDPTHFQRLKQVNFRATESQLGPKVGIDPLNLAETGWGVIFSEHVKPGVSEALSELLDFRKEQATQKHDHYYQEYIGYKAYRQGESTQQFLARHKVSGVDAADPDKMPYYLLLVGDPEEIPYRFQYELDVQYAVGRIHFDTLEEYAQYARSVVDSEKGKVSLRRQAAFFGVRNTDDQATKLSSQELVKPLTEMLPDELTRVLKDHPQWSLHPLLENQATKAQLSQLLGGAETPALLFTASHGMGFPNGDPRQLRHQGALLCQDWPGPYSWQQPIPEDHYFSADDVSDDARLLGSIAFFFACYGAGTPLLDDFAHVAHSDQTPIAPYPFIAQLPKRLLGHPKGGALATVGHIERAWTYSFVWPDSGGQTGTFRDTLVRLMQGQPIGWAMEFFNVRHGALAVRLVGELQNINRGKDINARELSGMWTANNDACNYVIIGDPAVRLPLGKSTIAEDQRPPIGSVTIQTPTTTTEPPSPSTQESTPSIEIPEAATEFGVRESLQQTSENLTRLLKQFSTRLSQTLEKAVDDVSSLEVATYVSDEMSDVKYDTETGRFSGTTKLGALTRIKLDGDTKSCVSEKEGEPDQALWKIHADMVQQAQAQRTELLKMVTSAATGLLDVLK